MDSLSYLTLIITYRCSSSCGHCCIGSGPAYSEWMTPEDADIYISEVQGHGKLKWTTLIGGEALLDVDRTIQIGQIAKGCGIPTVEIDTNASWASDDDITREVLQRVFDAGLRIGQVSVDSFHKLHVDQEKILRLFRIATELGLDLKGSGAVIDPKNPLNKLDRETLLMHQQLKTHGFNVTLAPVVFQGRAVNLHPYHSGPRHIPEEPCSGVYFFATDDWQSPGGIQIDVYGNVMLDHGICIGNTLQQDLPTILDTYNAETHPVISVLMKEGPMGLTRLPEADGFKLRRDGYIDNCHLCQEIRTHLRTAFPDILCPSSYYPEIQR